MPGERRKDKRVSLNKDYCFYPEDRKHRFNCMTNNISVTGACIQSERKLKIDDVVYIHIESDKDTQFKSKVVWEIEDTYGLQFLLETNTDFDNISYIMNHYANTINK